MRYCYKFLVAFLLLVGFIIFACILWLENSLIQLIVLLVTGIVFWRRAGFVLLVKEIKLLIPFVLMLMGVYLLFGVFGLGSSQNQSGSVLSYWLFFGLNRVMLLIATVLFVQVLLFHFSIADVIGLPISIHKKKYLILGQILYGIAMKKVGDLEFHIESVPANQQRKKKWREAMNKKLALILSLLFLVTRESEYTGEIIDNRIKHCYNEEDK
ncbi:MAG: hypothetical protein U1C33_05170 [Candidatus Cloacimonadaceae bacterium]|nr:hypothetical protein [Candidatus Cloacimonadaceae bacterium]